MSTPSAARGSRDKNGTTPRRSKPRRSADARADDSSSPAPRPSLLAAWGKAAVVRYAVSAIAVPVAAAFAATHWLDTAGSSTAAVAAIAGAILVVAFAVHRTAAPHLGRLTAIAALTLLCSAAFTTWAVLAPQCPDSDYIGRCTGPEVANWAMIGVLLTATYALFGSIPFVVYKFGKTLLRGARHIVSAWRGATPEVLPSDAVLEPQTSLFQRWRMRTRRGRR